MLNILYKGIFENENQLIQPNPKQEATKFKEPDSFSKVFVHGLLLIIPVFIPMTILMVLSFYNQITSKNIHFNIINCLFLLIFCALLLFGVQYIHEIIHALFYPLKETKELWKTKDSSAMFIFCNAHVSKKRFIWITLSPNIILGAVPFVLVICLQEVLSFWIFAPISLIAFLSIMIGIGDYYNAFNSMKQVPSNGIIYNSGLHSYWYSNGGEKA